MSAATKECLWCKKLFTISKSKHGSAQICCSRKCKEKRWSRDHRTSQYEMFAAAKKRAKIKGVEFSITQNDVCVPETCPLLGVPLLQCKKCLGPNSPSLDRIDPSKGYVPGNVWVISYRANAAKSNLTLSELKTLVENLEDKMTETKLHETRKG